MEAELKVSQFVYPAIFVKNEDIVAVNFPDLGITTDGESYEEAFLFAKDFLHAYILYALRCDVELPEPSFFADIDDKNIFNKVMLLDTLIFSNDLENKNLEESYDEDLFEDI